MIDNPKIIIDKVIPKNTSLIGVIPENDGLHLTIIEDLEISDLRNVIDVPFSIENIGSGEHAIFINAYADRSSVSTSEIIQEVKKKYQRDLIDSFTLAYFEIKTESVKEEEVFDKLNEFISTKVFKGQNWKVKTDLVQAQQVFALLILAFRCAKMDINISDIFKIEEFEEEDIPFEKINNFTSLPEVVLGSVVAWSVLTEIFAGPYIKYDNVSWINKAFQFLEPATKLNPERVKNMLSNSLYKYVEDGTNRSYFTNSLMYDFVITNFVRTTDKPAKVYDPAMGFGNTLLSILSNYELSPLIDVEGMEINSGTFRFAVLNFMLHEANSMLLTNQDSLNAFDQSTNDVIVSVPPVGRLNKQQSIIVNGENSISTKYLEERFLLLGIQALNEKGRGYFIVPNSFLQRRSKLKKYLLDQDLIEAVVQIPRVLRETIESSLIILNKSKNIPGFVFLASLSSMDLSSRNYEKNNIDFRLLLPEIMLEYTDFINDSLRRNQHELTKIQPIKNLDNGFLLPNYYIFDQSRDLTAFVNNPKTEKLSNIITDIKRGVPKSKSKNSDISTSIPSRFISPKDLRDFDQTTFFNYQTTDKKYYPLQTEFILQDECVIIPTFPNHQALIFKPSIDHDFAISNHLFAVKIDTNRMLPEFFIDQWNSEMFKIQFERFASGSSHIPSISINTLKEIYIEIPSIEEQRHRLELHKDESNQFMPVLSESRIDHKNMYDAMKHYIGNRVVPTNGHIKSLHGYIDQLHETTGGNMTDLISNFDNSTIDDTLFRIISFVEDVGSLAVNIQKLYEIDTPLQLKRQGLIPTIKKLCRKYAGSIGYKVQGENVLLDIDESCFSIVIENLFTNFRKHGIDGIDSPKVEFEVVSRNDEDFVEIYYKNNGNPFPADYSFEDYLHSNKGAGTNPGTGLGGTLIRVSVEKHKGVISPVTLHDLASDGWNIVLKINLNRRYV